MDTLPEILTSFWDQFGRPLAAVVGVVAMLRLIYVLRARRIGRRRVAAKRHQGDARRRGT